VDVGDGEFDGDLVCVCDATLADGYWTGRACTDCLDGWLGDACRTMQPSSSPTSSPTDAPTTSPSPSDAPSSSPTPVPSSWAVATVPEHVLPTPSPETM
jgi:hypothetical protein